MQFGRLGQFVFGMMSTMPAPSPAHTDLSRALTELYTLLDTLGAIEPNLVRLPPYAPDALNRSAALAAGYAPEAVELMGQIPYLDVDSNEQHLEIMPNTVPTNHLCEGSDQGYFEDMREMFDEEMMAPTAVRLTSSLVYGKALVYNVSTQLLHPWATFEGPQDSKNYAHVPGVAPGEVLDPLIKKYRELTYIARPRWPDPSNPDQLVLSMEHNNILFSESGGLPPKDWSADEQTFWHGQYDCWKAVRKLRDLYLECGWDVNTSEQRSFRREEFLQRRMEYWKDVLEPQFEKHGGFLY